MADALLTAGKEGTLHTLGCNGLADGHTGFEYGGGILVEENIKLGVMRHLVLVLAFTLST